MEVELLRRVRTVAVFVTLAALASGVVLVLTAGGPAPAPLSRDALACAGAVPRVPPSDWCTTPTPVGSPAQTPSPTPTSSSVFPTPIRSPLPTPTASNPFPTPIRSASPTPSPSNPFPG
jgi:hypothetical protein